MKDYWWKLLGVFLVFYAIIGGLLMPVPALVILHETIRNLYYHVSMWFGMMIIMLVSVIYSIRFLNSNKISDDTVAAEAANAGILLGILGLITGSVWARFTWGAWWVHDPKLDGAAVTMLIYLAYLVLRSSVEDEQKRGRISAVYNVFAYVMLVVFLMVYPRMKSVDSLHPGNGGNPAFFSYDLDKTMRIVFYPAVIGWTLIGVWMMSLRVRIKKLEERL